MCTCVCEIVAPTKFPFPRCDYENLRVNYNTTNKVFILQLAPSPRTLPKLFSRGLNENIHHFRHQGRAAKHNSLIGTRWRMVREAGWQQSKNKKKAVGKSGTKTTFPPKRGKLSHSSVRSASCFMRVCVCVSVLALSPFRVVWFEWDNPKVLSLNSDECGEPKSQMIHTDERGRSRRQPSSNCRFYTEEKLENCFPQFGIPVSVWAGEIN